MNTQTKKIWNIDPNHSEINFKVKHLMINTVTGQFKKFEGKVESEGSDFENAKVEFTADIASIETGTEARDNHLKSNDFFNAEKHPQLKFTSTGFKRVNDNHYDINGNITIRETTQPIALKAEYGGKMTDGYGNEKAGFEITGQLKRKDFGLNWDAVTEAGGVVVSNDVRLNMNVQLQLNK